MGRNFDPNNVDEKVGTFDAEIVAAEFVPGNRPQTEQLKISLEPKSYEGKVRYEWYNYKEKPGPKAIWARFLKQLEKLEIALSEETDLVGYTLTFMHKEFDFGEIEGDDGEKKHVVVKRLWPIAIVNAPATTSDGKKVEFSEEALVDAIIDESVKSKDDAFNYFASERKSTVLKAIKKAASEKKIQYDSKTGEVKAV